MLDNLKTMLGIEGNSQDSVLMLLIEAATKRLLAYLKPEIEEVPDELSWIVVELALSRFNRMGNEGMQTYSQEGESIGYLTDDIAPYKAAIDAWNLKQEDNIKGVVRFL